MQCSVQQTLRTPEKNYKAITDKPQYQRATSYIWKAHELANDSKYPYVTNKSALQKIANPKIEMEKCQM